MLTNKEARNLADIYVDEVINELSDELLLVVLFGSTSEGKEYPSDVDILLCLKNGNKPNYSLEHVNVCHYTLDQIREVIQGKGVGQPNFLRRIMLGGGEVLYARENYYVRINNAFSSRNPDYLA